MTDNTPANGQLFPDDITTRLIQENSSVTYNIGQNVIVTTEDKIRLCLTKHLQRMEIKNSWAVPLGILLTILIIFPTTSFKNFIIDATVWQAVFIISGIISFLWFLASAKKARTNTSMDTIINEIKESSRHNN